MSPPASADDTRLRADIQTQCINITNACIAKDIPEVINGIERMKTTIKIRTGTMPNAAPSRRSVPPPRWMGGAWARALGRENRSYIMSAFTTIASAIHDNFTFLGIPSLIAGCVFVAGSNIALASDIILLIPDAFITCIRGNTRITVDYLIDQMRYVGISETDCKKFRDFAFNQEDLRKGIEQMYDVIDPAFSPTYVKMTKDIMQQYIDAIPIQARTQGGARRTAKRASGSTRTSMAPKWLPTSRTVTLKGTVRKLWKSAKDASVLAVKRIVKAADGSKKARFQRV